VAATAASGRLRIGQLARVTGFTPKTLRYYESIGLLRPVSRTLAGYRLYGEAAVERLRFVRRAQALGLSLRDIGAILEISDAGCIPCEHVVAIVDRELGHIEAELRRLRSRRRDLLALRSKMSAALASGSARPGRACPCIAEDAGA
jgi:DNA-binding transcriptional MerR regulator